MGFIRVFRIGLIAGLRNRRRVIPIAILFLLLFSVVTYQLSKIEAYSTDSLLSSRGVVVEANGDVSVSDVYDYIGTLKSGVREYLAALFVVYYVELIPGELGAITVRAYQGENGGFDWRWVIDETKPTRIIDGRHISSKGEVIVNYGYNFDISSGGLSISHTISPVGSIITIKSGDKSPLKLRIVGVYNVTQPGYNRLTGGAKNLIVMTWEDFSDLVTRIWPDPAGSVSRADYVYVRRLVFLAKGDLMSGKNLESVSEIKTKLTDLLSGDSRFFIQSTQNIDPNAFRSDVTWGLLTILFSIILAFIYAFILVRFKSRDIATLRAIGWSRRDVMGYALGELFMIIVVSYLVSMMILSFFSVIFGIVLTLTPMVYLESIAVMFVTLFFGFIIVNRRVTKIPPEKAFREG